MRDRCCTKGRVTRISRLCGAAARSKRIRRGGAWTLFRHDGADDEAMFAGWVEGNFGAGGGGLHQRDDIGIVERVGRGQANVADEIAIALQYFFWIGQAFALQKK